MATYSQRYVASERATNRIRVSIRNKNKVIMNVSATLDVNPGVETDVEMEYYIGSNDKETVPLTSGASADGAGDVAGPSSASGDMADNASNHDVDDAMEVDVADNASDHAADHAREVIVIADDDVDATREVIVIADDDVDATREVIVIVDNDTDAAREVIVIADDDADAADAREVIEILDDDANKADDASNAREVIVIVDDAADAASSAKEVIVIADDAASNAREVIVIADDAASNAREVIVIADDDNDSLASQSVDWLNLSFPSFVAKIEPYGFEWTPAQKRAHYELLLLKKWYPPPRVPDPNDSASQHSTATASTSRTSTADSVFSANASPADSVTDVNDDDDQASIASADSATVSASQSLSESLYRFEIENGRSYHIHFDVDYLFPHDEKHMRFVERQAELYLHFTNNRLHYSPVHTYSHHVLDLGTGRGDWAMEYARRHPYATVDGVDLCLQIDSDYPNNVSFHVDDVEKEWSWFDGVDFDLIYWRFMHGCFFDNEAMIARCFSYLNYGGYLEIFDGLTLRIEGPDTYSRPALVRLVRHATWAAKRCGRPIDKAIWNGFRMARTGFVDIVESQVLWPINEWKATHLSHYVASVPPGLGDWVRSVYGSDLEGLFLALLTRHGDLSRDAAERLCQEAWADLQNTNVRMYWVFHLAYGRKPYRNEVKHEDPFIHRHVL